MTRDSDGSNSSADGRTKTTRLPIPAMNCPWNARRIADHLQRVDGVVETALGPRSDTVVVRFDPDRTSKAAMTAAVESPETAGGRGRKPTHTSRRSSGCRCRGRKR